MILICRCQLLLGVSKLVEYHRHDLLLTFAYIVGGFFGSLCGYAYVNHGMLPPPHPHNFGISGSFLLWRAFKTYLPKRWKEVWVYVLNARTQF